MKNFLLFFLFVAVISFSARAQNLLVHYSFNPNDVEGDTIIDQSGNGNNGLLVGGASIGQGTVKIGFNNTDYLNVPPVINGLNDFTIDMKLSVSSFRHKGNDPMNTIYSASNQSCTYCFGLAYNRSNNAWEVTLNGVVHSIPQSLVGNIDRVQVEVIREAGLVSLYYSAVFLGSFTDSTPLDATTLIFGQHEQCLGGCFDKQQAMHGWLTQLGIADGAVYLKQSDEQLTAPSLFVSPNPFSSSATISFSTQQDSHTTIALYDLAGRKIKTLLDENVAAGNHELILNRDQLTAGIYFLKANISGSSTTIKIVIE